MSCFKPLKAYQDSKGNIVFKDDGRSLKLDLPCGQCIGCRLDKSQQWALRCVHEASLHDDNCFITLTYGPKHLPPDGGLRKRDYQLFMKRLRKEVKSKIKFYMCGEYGDKNNRPHYHAIIFGYNFPDWVYLFDSPGGYPIYTSPTLERIWNQGFVTVGTVTFESAAYVARYILKKINGDKAEEVNNETGLKHYERINDFTGEIHEVLPEYSLMSRGGTHGRGIAHGWISRYQGDCYPKDFTTVRGRKVKPPKYYDKYLETIDKEMYDEIKEGRRLKLLESGEHTVNRLRQKETVTKAKTKQLKRNI